ncbi:MAG: PspC domain-containing protein [Bacteroidaceae bacterium]|nr:PspC domain-containing protein [Bacteroidaceae bacterium]
MKKNITINLQGRLYAIDEDAYELLNHYTDSLRNYFARSEGGEEIADDIESRIVELFDEQKRNGAETVTIEQMESIIHRIGNPGEMDGATSDTSDEGDNPEREDAPSSAGEQEEASIRQKRLYRNPADRKFMGVLSGFAAYLGGDVLFYRLGFVLLSLFFMFAMRDGIRWVLLFVLLYAVFAMLMPVADTPEERLRMKGKKVNPQNLADEVSQAVRVKSGETPTGCIASFFFMLGAFGRGCIYSIGIMLAVFLLCGVGIFIAFMTLTSEELVRSIFGDDNIWLFISDSSALSFFAALAVIILLVIPAYCIIHSLFTSFKQLKPMSFRLRLSLLIVWIVAFVATIIAGTRLVGRHDVWCAKHTEYRRAKNTHDGIYYMPREWNFLSTRGWRVTLAENCNDRYTAVGQYYTGDPTVRYIDNWDDAHRQRFTICRYEHLMPGTYRISGCVRAEGQGACIFVRLGAKSPAECYEIPADNNMGGNIWAEAVAKRDSILRRGEVRDSLELERLSAIAAANGARGFGWNRITLPDITIKKPQALYYGITTDPELTGRTWLGRWFSACDFTLERISKK